MMRAKVWPLLLVAGVAAADPPPGPEPRFQPPRAVPGRLANGVGLLVVENHRLPLVTATLVVRGAGAAADPEGKGGLAAFTADLLDEGAGGRGALDLARAVETLGGALSISVGPEAATVSLSTLAANLGPALDLLGEVVTAPGFDAAEAARVHADRSTALLRRRDRPREVAEVRLDAALFGEGSPLGHPVDGTAESFARVTLADARGFYRDAWQPASATLIVVGDVRPGQVNAERLAAWKGRGSPVRPAAAAQGGPLAARLVLVDRPGAAQSDVRFGVRSLARGDARSYAWDVLLNAFGGGFTGRLTQRLREQLGYLYHVYPEAAYHRGGGAYGVLAPLFAPRTAEGMKEVLAMVSDLAKHGLPAAELDKAKQNLIRDLPDRFEANLDTASAFAELVTLGLPPGWYDGYAARIARVKSREVKAAARALLDGKLVFVVVGDLAKIEKEVGALGLGTAVRYDLDGKPR